MTNHPSAPASTLPIDFGPLTPDDPRIPFAQAVALASEVMEKVRPSQLDDGTACADFDVRGLRAHLIGVLRRVAAVGRGDDPGRIPLVVTDVTDNGVLAAWYEAAGDVQTVWSDSLLLGRLIRLPFATLPGAVTMAIYTAEVTVHTWDLAHATRQHPTWDEQVLGVALGALRHALPADQRGEGVPFAPVVEIGTDAPLIERLVAWSGRRP